MKNMFFPLPVHGVFHGSFLRFSSRCLLGICMLFCAGIINASHVVYMKDYGVLPSTTIDATPGVSRALAECIGKPNSVLVFEKGEYHFWGDKACEKYCFTSNNDEGLKRIIFSIENAEGLTIDGNGSSFVFHGFVNPFVIYSSTDVTLKNFSVDFSRTFHSEGIILASDKEGEMDLEIPSQFPFEIRNNILVFTDKEEPQSSVMTTVSKDRLYSYGSLLEFDTHKRETAFMARDYYINSIPLVAKRLSDNKVRIYLDGIKGTVGNTLVFGAGHRNYSDIIVSDSRDIEVNHVTIHHAGGMGVVAQRTHNVSVLNCKFVPSPGRVVSCTADATHFVNCTGKVELGNSTFMNQMDDATNIHGIYVQIVEQLSPTEVYVRLKHPQQFGFDFLKKGTRVELVQGKSLITKGEAVVLEAERLNKEMTRVKLDTPLPAGIGVGDAMGDVKQLSEVHIHHNYIGKNRARGMLLNSRGKTVVEHNTFHSPGAAILFEGDAQYWFEQGGVRECIVRNNLFDNCLYGVWGKAVIDVGAGITDNKEESRYNRNVQVYDNTFRVFDDVLLLQAYCVDGIYWENNKLERTADYPALRTNLSPFKVEYCDDVRIDHKETPMGFNK